jgi:hypothetical protein
MRHRINMLLFCAMVLGMASCKVSDDTDEDRPPLTLPAPSAPVFLGDCSLNRDLEGWLQTTTFQQDEFITLMQGGVGKSSQDLYTDVERMGVLRNVVSAAPAPDCAAEAHTTLLAAMDAVLIQYQAYVNGEQIDLQSVVNEQLPNFDIARAIQSELLERLDSQYGTPTN